MGKAMPFILRWINSIELPRFKFLLSFLYMLIFVVIQENG